MKSSGASAPWMARMESDEQSRVRDRAAGERQGLNGEGKRKATIGDIIVSEGLSKEIILTFVQEQADEIERCHFGSNPPGTLEVNETRERLSLAFRIRSASTASR